MPSQTSDIQLGQSMMALFTGHPGTRKTSAAASYPGPIYFFDFDGRMAPVKKVFPERNDVFFDTYNSFEPANRIMKRWMKDGPDDAPNGEKYKTIVVDSLTTVSKKIIRDSKAILRPGGNKNQKGSIQVTEIEDFNYETAGLEDLVSFLKTMNEDFKLNTILTAHLLVWDEAIAGKENIGKTQQKSQLLTAGKKVAPYIPVVFDEVYHFEAEYSLDGTKCRAFTDVYAEHFAKTALPLPYMIDFTNKPFYDQIKNHLANL